MGLLFFSFAFSLSLIFYALYIIHQKRKGIVKFIPFKHIKGINRFAEGIDVLISFNENIIIIDNVMIPNSKISKLQISSSKQLVNKENSVIGRAVIGGILTGGVGAIVGGMSGINDGSKVTKLIHYLILTFKDEKEIILSFKNDNNIKDLDGVLKKFNK